MNISELYAKSSSASSNDAVEYLDKYSHLLKWKNCKESILEVGCGDGYITKKLLYPLVENYVEKLKAVDLSANMIEFARKSNDVDKIEFEVMDMSKDDGIVDMQAKFDHIFSFYCAHFILDQRSFIERLSKMLKPGGQLLATAITDSPLHESFKKHRAHEIWSNYVPKTSPFADFSADPEQFMQDLLKQAGFKIELCKATMKTSRFNDLQEFVRALIGMHPFLNYIPKEKQKDYIEDHVRNYCEASVQSDNPKDFNVTYGSLIFVASKNT